MYIGGWVVISRWSYFASLRSSLERCFRQIGVAVQGDNNFGALRMPATNSFDWLRGRGAA